jgi:hypothetical protein
MLTLFSPDIRMNIDDRLLDDACRREHLIRLLACGTLGLVPAQLARAGWFSSDPEKLADDKSIHSLEGVALVNGRAANLETRIYAGDRVETGEGSEIIFAVGGDSFILRGTSVMEIEGGNFLVKGLKLLSGALLSVFGPRHPTDALKLTASTATIGIRGTGVYLEAEPDLAYVCTCYGQASLAASADPDDSEIITTTNHDMPRYITSQAVKGTRIRPAPVINHDDSELKLLEAIVGRKVPKGFGKRGYTK